MQGTPQARRRPAHLATVALAVGFALLVAAGLATLRVAGALAEADRWVVHTFEVRASIDRFVSQVARMESTVRAYGLTGDPFFRKRFDDHRSEVLGILGELEGLVADNPAQLARAGRLRELAGEKVGQNARLLQAGASGGQPAAARFLESLPREQTSALVNLADAMQAEEDRLLGLRLSQQARVEREARLVQRVGSALAVILFGAAAALSRRATAARRQAEASLLKSERMFQRLFESSPDAVILIGPDGIVLRANARAEALFGRPPRSMNGLEVAWLVPERFRAGHGRHLATYFQDPAPRSMGESLELFGLRRDGSEFPVEILLSPVESDEGTLALAVIRDVSERKRIEADLRAARDQALAASRLKSDFLATMSHEIRTPMNGVLGMAEILGGTSLDAEQRDMLKVIHRSAESLLAVINDILDLSRIESGRLRIEAEEFGLRELLEEVTALFAVRARSKGLALTCETGAGLDGGFRGDAGRLRQILVNLAGNAVKFTDKGEVAIRAELVREEEAAATIRVAVKDTGVGIPREAHPRLFQPFSQADATAARRFGGTGLGLAITRSLVSLMGGDLGFESEPGKGSTFWFELALRRADQPGAASQALPPGDKPAHPRLNVLLVEDEETNRAVARLMLERLGHRVEIAANGPEASAKLAAGRYDVVFMDCQLPGIDGFELTRRIRSGAVPGADPSVPIIALTAYAMAADRQKCLDAGMNDHVSKPVTTEALEEALKFRGRGRA